MSGNVDLQTVKHILSIDVESSARAFGDDGAPDKMLEQALADLLEILGRSRVRAFFFVLVSDLPGLENILQQAARAGHEIGSHGMRHQRCDHIEPEMFRAALAESRRRIEDVTQKPCIAFRAPWFSAPCPPQAWFFEALAETGFQIDSSLRLPVREISSFNAPSPNIREIPVPLVRIMGLQPGVLGGPALRVLPKFAIRRLFRKVSNLTIPACVYLHPYEWSKEKARHGGFRRSLLLRRTLPRLEWLLHTFEFSSLSE